MADLQILLLLVATRCQSRDGVEVAGGDNLLTKAPPFGNRRWPVDTPLLLSVCPVLKSRLAATGTHTHLRGKKTLSTC